MNILLTTAASGLVALSLTLNSDAQTVAIGSQEWATNNLAVGKFRNGESIPEANSAEAWVQAAQQGRPAWCYYAFSSANAERYGKLYNYYAVADPRGLAPFGWRVPAITDYNVLKESLGGYDEMGKKMKSKALKGNNSSGFNALGGGRCDGDGLSKNIKQAAFFWFTDIANDNKASALELYPANDFPAIDQSLRGTGFSVRCLKDDSRVEAIENLADGSSVTTVLIGDQTWYSQNMATTKFRNGDDIPQAKSAEEWSAAANNKTPAWAYANFDEQHANLGKLYNFYAVKDARGLAPKGYHVPSNDDWNKLRVAAGGANAGNAIRSVYGWEIAEKQYKTATNSTGFSAFPLQKIWDEGSYHGFGSAEWWSATLYSEEAAYFYSTSYIGPELNEMAGDSFGIGHAVRCVKD